MDRILIVMRHGHYEYPNLTPRGEQQAQSIATQVANDNLAPDLILHSPVTRAVQTAKQVHAIFSGMGKAPEMQQVDWLHDNMFTAPDHLQLITPDKRIVLLVTHQPNVEGLTHAFNQPQCPNYAGTYAFGQTAANWNGFTAPKLLKAWRPA